MEPGLEFETTHDSHLLRRRSLREYPGLRPQSLESWVLYSPLSLDHLFTCNYRVVHLP